MRCEFLQSLARLLAGVAAAATFSGCQTSSGFVTNSSGQNYYEQGNYAAAASEFQQAVMTDPTNPDYMANLAKVKAKMGEVASSEQLYRQALSVAPSHQPSYHGLAELMVAQGRGQEASSMLKTWAATQPYVAESHLEMAWLQREMGNPSAAGQSLQKALEVNPGHATALAHLGQYYQDVGRPDQAVAMYQQSLRADWNQPEVHSRVAAASQAAGAAHPMAATAMARGVHPYEMARQPSVLGGPSQGAQVAQMQLQQWQMAQSAGMRNPAMTSMAQTAFQPPSYPASSPFNTASFQGSPPNMMMNNAVYSQLNSGTVVNPASLNPAGMPVREGEWTVVPGSYRVIDSGMPAGSAVSSSPPGSLSPAPTPDSNFPPALQSVPATTVSTQASTPVTGNQFGLTASSGTSEPPVLDAF
jgi:Tfp pilus assembly protein PilF